MTSEKKNHGWALYREAAVNVPGIDSTGADWVVYIVDPESLRTIAEARGATAGEAEARARLIKAAPEMKNAIDLLLDAHTRSEISGAWECARKAAKSAGGSAI